jgi:DNA-binding transcriptional LysR family regulator
MLEDAESAVIQLTGRAARLVARDRAPTHSAHKSSCRSCRSSWARYPDVRIDMNLSNEIVDLVATDVDLALRVGTLVDSTLVARPLGSFSTHIYASPAYLARYGEPLVPVDVAHHRALALTQHTAITVAMRGRCANGAQVEEQTISPVLRHDEPSALRNAALAGLGIAILPDRLAAPHEADGTLQRVLSVWAGPDAELNAVFPARSRAAAQGALLHRLSRRAAGLPAPGCRTAARAVVRCLSRGAAGSRTQGACVASPS